MGTEQIKFTLASTWKSNNMTKLGWMIEKKGTGIEISGIAGLLSRYAPSDISFFIETGCFAKIF